MQDFAAKFKLSELTIKQYQYWQVSVRPVQLTLGALVLSLKRDCTSLGALQIEEAAELAQVYHDIERALTGLFNYDKINHLALMMVDDQVHFHVLPRYQQQRNYAGICFEDKAWPGPITDFQTGPAEQDLLLQLRAVIAEALTLD